jgi:hypothetical protein
MNWRTLMLADFDPSVEQIVAQSFRFQVDVDGQPKRLIPDYLLAQETGTSPA